MAAKKVSVDFADILHGFDFTLREMEPAGIISIEGLDKSGKTDLACRAPGPNVYMALDLGEEGVVQKHQKEGKVIGRKRYTWSWDPQAKAKGDYEAQGEVIRTGVWKAFEDDYWRAVESPKVRTITWDTATEVWELLRLAEFGKLLQNPQAFYGPINSAFKEMVRAAAINGKILVLLHQQKEEQLEEVLMTEKGPKKSLRKTGKLLRQGMNKIGNLVDVYVETRYVAPVFAKDKAGRRTSNERIDGGYFEVEVLKARHNEPANGMVLRSPSFEEVMSVAMPEVDWGLGKYAEKVAEIADSIGDLDLGV